MSFDIAVKCLETILKSVGELSSNLSVHVWKMGVVGVTVLLGNCLVPLITQVKALHYSPCRMNRNWDNKGGEKTLENIVKMERKLVMKLPAFSPL